MEYKSQALIGKSSFSLEQFFDATKLMFFEAFRNSPLNVNLDMLIVTWAYPLGSIAKRRLMCPCPFLLCDAPPAHKF